MSVFHLRLRERKWTRERFQVAADLAEMMRSNIGVGRR
jgi:hypothetical protein